MRRRDPLDPDVVRELEAIDAALAGRPVAAEDAELAQLSSLLVAERPQLRPDARAALDARVEARFERSGARGASGTRRDPATPAAPRRGAGRHRRPLIPAFAATAAVALVAVTIALQSGGDDGSSSTSDVAVSSPASGTAAPAAEPERGAGSADGFGTTASPQQDLGAPDAAGESAAPVSPPPVDALGGGAGRKVERSSTVELGAPADRVDDVAQDVIGVVGRQQGIVDQSTVATGSGGGEARFQLRIPSARLQATLAQLSRLPDAHVLARTDDTLDVNQAYVSAQRRRSSAEAERAGVLRALRAAGSEAETDRMTARLGELDRSIAQLEASQRALDRRVEHSRIDLTVRADDRSAAPGDGDEGGFTPASAFDDAGRVLAVTAGVVVIAAAALVPVALLLLILWPLVRSARRRRREHTLDTA